MLSQGSTAGGGFIDLISLLLATPVPAPDPTAASSGDTLPSNNAAFSNEDPSVSPGITFSKNWTYASSRGIINSATPDQIASALIRFMTKGNRAATPVVTPASLKKTSPLPKTAGSPTPVLTLGLPLNYVLNYLDKAGPQLSNAIIVPVPQPVVVSVDPQSTQRSVSISSESVDTPASLNRAVPMAVGSRPSWPTINNSVPDTPTNPLPHDRSLPMPSFPDLNVTDSSPTTKSPVAFQMQLTPLNSPDVSDPRTTTIDPRSLIVPQHPEASRPMVAAEAEPAKPDTATLDPAPPPPSNAIPTSAVISPVVFNDPASTAVQDAGNAKEAITAASKPIGAAKASASMNPGSPAKTVGTQASTTKSTSARTSTEDKPAAETKPGSETDTPGDEPEKSPVAVAPPTPASPPIPGAPFPSSHAPVPTSVHMSATVSKTTDAPASPLPVSGIKDVIAEPQPSSGQTQQIDVRISPPQAPAVDLQVSQRSGQIQVVVRTPDAGLETALRQDLGTLVHSLERSGFQAETFIPGASEASRMNSQPDPRHTHPDSSGNSSFAQSGNPNQGRNNGRGSGGNSRGNASRDPRQFEAWTNPQEQQT